MFTNDASNVYKAGPETNRVQVTDEGLNRDIHLPQRTNERIRDGENRDEKEKELEKCWEIRS